MAHKTTEDLRVVGIKSSTIFVLQVTLFALVGLVTAITYAVSESANFIESTDSLLRGLTFGLASGVLSIIFVPLIYFVIGWVIGLLQGLVLNALVRLSGGIVVKTEKSER